MTRIYAMTVALMSGIAALGLAPVAHADDPVIYEVRSGAIPTANIEWSDTAGDHSLQNASLPWRTSVLVANANSDVTRIHVTWQPGTTGFPNSGRYMWVSTRIYFHGSQLCEITLDVGESDCTGLGYYSGLEVPRR